LLSYDWSSEIFATLTLAIAPQLQEDLMAFVRSYNILNV
jgi:hypothetical protein